MKNKKRLQHKVLVKQRCGIDHYANLIGQAGVNSHIQLCQTNIKFHTLTKNIQIKSDFNRIQTVMVLFIKLHESHTTIYLSLYQSANKSISQNR